MSPDRAERSVESIFVEVAEEGRLAQRRGQPHSRADIPGLRPHRDLDDAGRDRVPRRQGQRPHLHTAVGLLFLSSAIFFARPRIGIAGDLTGDGSGSVTSTAGCNDIFAIPP